MVKLTFLEAGHCFHPEVIVIQGGRLAKRKFPSTVAVIEHPREGVILFDTGYSQRFHEQTRKFPERLYAMVTPVHVRPEESAAAQLAARGIAARDVTHVVLSHFHADHVAGVGDFPRARYSYLRSGWDGVRELSGLGAVAAGFLRGLLPGDFEARSRPIASEKMREGAALAPFSAGFDLFDDGSVVLVELPGHAKGHAGLFVRSDAGPFFLVADACWLARAYQDLKMPSPIARLIMHDSAAYRRTLEGIRQLSREQPGVRVVPCHCSDTYAAVPAFGEPR
jgi:glyoxylase-like metal-dependent hydrolase (beta-lactamase superfamily II)